uniref:Uncharacterized protein n=1 Tax=Pyropia tenera TaxID=2785 RepID=C5IS69_PYRTE|nr:hypothetical protein [Neopyropia tenera]
MPLGALVMSYSVPSRQKEGRKSYSPYFHSLLGFSQKKEPGVWGSPQSRGLGMEKPQRELERRSRFPVPNGMKNSGGEHSLSEQGEVVEKRLRQVEVVNACLKSTGKENSFFLLTMPFSSTMFPHVLVGSEYNERIIMLHGMRSFHRETHLFSSKEPIEERPVSTFGRSLIPHDPLIGLIIVGVKLSCSLRVRCLQERNMLKELGKRGFPSIGFVTSEMKHRLLVLALRRLEVVIEKRRDGQKLLWIGESFWMLFDKSIQLRSVNGFDKSKFSNSCFVQVLTVDFAVTSKS